MPYEVSIFDPRTMGRLVSRMPPVRTFFRDTFFRHTETFATKSVDVDFKKGNRALAPFVHPKMPGQTVPNRGSTTIRTAARPRQTAPLRNWRGTFRSLTK